MDVDSVSGNNNGGYPKFSFRTSTMYEVRNMMYDARIIRRERDRMYVIAKHTRAQHILVPINNNSKLPKKLVIPLVQLSSTYFNIVTHFTLRM